MTSRLTDILSMPCPRGMRRVARCPEIIDGTSQRCALAHDHEPPCSVFQTETTVVVGPLALLIKKET